MYMNAKQRRQLATLDALLAARRYDHRARLTTAPSREPERLREVLGHMIEMGGFVPPRGVDTSPAWVKGLRAVLWPDAPVPEYEHEEEQEEIPA